MDLLSSDDEDSNGLWNSITSTFSSKPVDEEDNKLNIFSLASGHLYERFIRIMMLSVLKNTKTPVKFWFLKNYLSPTLKDFLPHMAKEYGFEYELVEYKWPRWLHQQKEKQRIIWGYKILFLDVLFPLNIKKIIFVDADQVLATPPSTASKNRAVNRNILVVVRLCARIWRSWETWIWAEHPTATRRFVIVAARWTVSASGNLAIGRITCKVP